MRPGRLDFGNGAATDYTYDDVKGRLTNIYTTSVEDVGGVPTDVAAVDIDYAYDYKGQLTSYGDAVDTDYSSVIIPGDTILNSGTKGAFGPFADFRARWQRIRAPRCGARGAAK